MIKAILFDIDGTLVDSNNLHIEAWTCVFNGAGLSFDREALRAQMGKGGDNLLTSLFPDLADDRYEELIEQHGDLFRTDLTERVRPFPDARALLERAQSSRTRVVLATAAGRKELDYYVALLDIADILHATTSKDDVDVSKPAPDIFAAALKKAGVKVDEAIVVGDTPYDVEAAAKAGIGTVAVPSGGFDRNVLEEAGADVIYPDVATLLADYDVSPLGR